MEKPAGSRKSLSLQEAPSQHSDSLEVFQVNQHSEASRQELGFGTNVDSIDADPDCREGFPRFGCFNTQYNQDLSRSSGQDSACSSPGDEIISLLDRECLEAPDMILSRSSMSLDSISPDLVDHQHGMSINVSYFSGIPCGVDRSQLCFSPEFNGEFLNWSQDNALDHNYQANPLLRRPATPEPTSIEGSQSSLDISQVDLSPQKGRFAIPNVVLVDRITMSCGESSNSEDSDRVIRCLNITASVDNDDYGLDNIIECHEAQFSLELSDNIEDFLDESSRNK